MAEFNNLTPITRREQFLQDIADGTVDKTPITREEWFLAQIAEAVAHGGGGGLPEYTDADADKGLFLVRDAEHPTEQAIVSEQTVSVTSESGLSGVAITHTGEIVNGETYTMTVNGVSESVTASTVLDSVVCILTITGGSAVISSGDGTDYTFTALTDGYVPIEGTYTISLTKSVPSVAPAWTNALPAVTAADDGDVLTVVDGAWGKAAPSGGGSLPEYTSADKGKGLFLTEGTAQTVMVVPEQTVELEEGMAELENTDTAFFINAQVGDTITANVNGSTIVLTAAEDNGMVAFTDGESITILYMDLGGFVVVLSPEETLTISATSIIHSVAPAWVKGSSILMVTATAGDPITLDKTYAEINSAGVAYIRYNGTTSLVSYTRIYNNTYCVGVVDTFAEQNDVVFTSSSANGVLSFQTPK